MSPNHRTNIPLREESPSRSTFPPGNTVIPRGQWQHPCQSHSHGWATCPPLDGSICLPSCRCHTQPRTQHDSHQKSGPAHGSSNRVKRWLMTWVLHSAGLKQACPNGVFVSLTPGDPNLWSGVIFVRKGNFTTIRWHSLLKSGNSVVNDEIHNGQAVLSISEEMRKKSKCVS